MYSTKDLITDLWVYIRPYKTKFWIATVLSFITEIAWLYPTYALAVIVNFFTTYTPGADLTIVYQTFLYTAIAIIVCYAGFYLSGTGIARVSEKAAIDAELHALRHLMRLDIAWHEKESSGGKFKRIERGSAAINRLLRIWIRDIIDIAVGLVGVTLIMFKFDATVAYGLIFFLVTYYAIRYFYRQKGIYFVEIVNKKEEVRSGMLFEAINNIRSVKVMSMAPVLIKKLAVNGTNLFSSIGERIFWFGAGNTISNFYAQMFRIGVMIFIVNGIVAGTYTIGFLILFTGYFATMWQSISKLTDVSEDIVIAKKGMERLRDMLAQPVTIDDEIGKVRFPADWKKIGIRKLSFSYGSKKVLNDVSFTIRRGEKIGIVGLSGAGKSTLFKLLLKEHESYKGTISFDETPLTAISKTDYFNYVAVVLQDTELFNASLKENITITNQKEEGNTKLLDDAIRIAHVKDFIKKLPKGVNSVIGEKGVKLSGGEKQRVGIARAIFKNPQIFLLDEATSHLDIESEEKIRDSLHAFFQGVTAIVIAHRLTTIKEMDRIVVLEDGKITEQGSFQELHDARGRFFELWEKQGL